VVYCSFYRTLAIPVRVVVEMGSVVHLAPTLFNYDDKNVEFERFKVIIEMGLDEFVFCYMGLVKIVAFLFFLRLRLLLLGVDFR